MCGYACVNCGRCRGEEPKYVTPLKSVPGYCVACETLNRPTATICASCGGSLANSATTRTENDVERFV